MPVAVEIREPATVTSAVVFASPHSGRVYPPEFLRATLLEETALRSSEDAFVDLLLAAVPEFGACLVTSEVPRAYVDFNRAADELDPALIHGAPRAGLNPRVSSGLGVLARVVAGGRAIYRGKLTMAEAQSRIARYWEPYHRALTELLHRQRARFGQVLLCDVHSMPSDALNGHVARGGVRPDIVVGDRWGAACDPAIVARVEAILRDAGLAVARNSPFAGAYIARRYGQPSLGMHAIQIEIDRGLYMDERRIAPSAAFDDFCAVMRQVTARLAALDLGERPVELAAE